MNIRMIIALTLLGIVVVFTLGNYKPVTVNLLFWNPSISLALLVFLLLACGVIIGYVLGSHTARHKAQSKAPEY
ncbi:MAG: lipopolysaccharide assembly protein LapA domain-containing protein [Desulfohalobiaceae bacterium]